MLRTTNYDKAGEVLNDSISVLLSNQPSAADTHLVDIFFQDLTALEVEAINLIGPLEQAVTGAHLDYFTKLELTSKEWILCKNSSTNAKRYGDLAAGNLAIQRDILEKRLRQIQDVRIAYNSLLKALK